MDRTPGRPLPRPPCPSLRGDFNVVCTAYARHYQHSYTSITSQAIAAGPYPGTHLSRPRALSSIGRSSRTALCGNTTACRCVQRCMHACYVYMCICVYVYMCICVYVYMYMCIRMTIYFKGSVRGGVRLPRSGFTALGARSPLHGRSVCMGAWCVEVCVWVHGVWVYHVGCMGAGCVGANGARLGLGLGRVRVRVRES